jgi:hypothetical protein
MVDRLGEDALDYRTIICDEAHQLKNRMAGRTKFVSKVGDRVGGPAGGWGVGGEGGWT